MTIDKVIFFVVLIQAVVAGVILSLAISIDD